ncbi:hypothetical protein DFJ58DRAFT_848380 [Suillus subalutaceus]|uniref:uncharacterized protein n=1 Tax=Suillus subalutaceus TaxID=48586 RepID=UPI001B860A88|nr:uncharacterized protein DFJ58DRAFT_848380 [Suillus subalutaceus]KAG1830727.1 hypothetical protein DFJ58DRAFT_848380 [Suillus subalutaceus]
MHHTNPQIPKAGATLSSMHCANPQIPTTGAAEKRTNNVSKLRGKRMDKLELVIGNGSKVARQLPDPNKRHYEKTKSADSVKGGVQAVKKGKGGRKDEPWEVELRVDKCVSFVYRFLFQCLLLEHRYLIENHSRYLFRCRLPVHNIRYQFPHFVAYGPHQEYSKKRPLAARVNLDLDGASNALVVMEPRLAVCEGFKHNEFCIICRDGSVEDNYLLLCDECPRVVCTNCVMVPPAFTQAIMSPHVTFRCICCHISGQHRPDGSLSVYHGFYRNQKPLLDTFLPIHATLELSVRAQISSESLLFVHLILTDYDTAGGAFKLAYHFLKPYFPNGGLVYQEVMFDVGTVSKVKTYQASVDDLVRTLSTNNWKRVVFGISNHTDNTHGDPFVGYDKNKYVATPVDNFLNIILAPWQVLVDHAAESFLWFFSCGALVNNAESFSKLRVSVARHGLSAAVAFDAVRFQPNFAAHLLLLQ